MRRFIVIAFCALSLLGTLSSASAHDLTKNPPDAPVDADKDLLYVDKMGKSSETAPVTFDSMWGLSTTTRVNQSWNTARPYGAYHQHYGTDLSLTADKAIKASYNGYVEPLASKDACEGYILTIRYDVNNNRLADDNTYIRYVHLEQRLVTAGSYVTKGQQIAVGGNTGTCTTGPHLHFDVQTVNAGLRRHISPFPWFRSLNYTWASQMAFNKNLQKTGSALYVDLADTDDGVTVPAVNVVLFWRTVGSTTWYNFPMTKPSGNTWKANPIGRIPPGTTVEYIIRSERSDMVPSSGLVSDGHYRWSWVQPQWRKPALDPNLWPSYSQADTWYVSY